MFLRVLCVEYCDIMSGFYRTYFLKTCIVDFDVYYRLVWLFLVFGMVHGIYLRQLAENVWKTKNIHK